MKHLKLFENFRDEQSPISSEEPLLELEEQMSPVLRKSLDLVGKNLKTDKEILDAIHLLGFETLSRRHRTADYAFRNPKKPENTYVIYNTGYVRVEIPVGSWTARHTKAKKWTGPVTKYMIPDKRDRLLFILRMALKSQGFYQEWKKSNYSSVADFLHAKRGFIVGKKYGL